MRQLIGAFLVLGGFSGVFKALAMACTDQYGRVATNNVASNISSMTGEQQGYLLGYFAVSLLVLIVGWNLASHKPEKSREGAGG